MSMVTTKTKTKTMYNDAKLAIMNKLLFEPNEHKYTRDGFLIPGVTSIIEPYLPYGNLPDDVRNRAMLRGTLVHKLTEVYDAGEMDADTYEEAIQANLDGYLLCWEKFLKKYKPTMTHAEVVVYHTLWGYAGTVDRVCYIDGVRTLLEIKTGGLIPEYAWQTAAYQLALNEGSTEPPVEKRIAVCLRETGTPLIKEHDDPTDIQAFTGALNIFNWKAANKRRV